MDDWTKEKFWKRPVFDPTAVGDDQPDAIYWQVGKALTAWERLEEDIGSLFSLLSHGGSTETLVLIKHLFGITESSSNRIGMVKTALELHFSYYWEDPRISAPFKNVLKTMGWASYRRNEIAHGRVTSVAVHRGEEKPALSGHFLTAPNYAINRSQPYIGGEWHADDVLGVDRSLYRYRAAEISILEEKFVLLGAKARELQCLAAKGEHRLPKIVLDLAEKGLLLRR